MKVKLQAKYIGIIIIVLLIVAGGYFISRGSYQTPVPIVTPEKTEEPTEAPATTQAPTSEVREINVIGTEFSFNPASINVKVGERVKIIFTNSGRVPHNLIIEELNVGTKTIGGRQEETIELTASSSGTYTFFCSVPGHRASGMEGSLKVE